MIGRREFVGGLGAAAAWPVAARGQQLKVPVIGFVNGGSKETFQDRLDGFLAGLRQAGYVEGRNITIEYRWADGNYDLLQQFLADLIERRAAVIAATGNTPVALAAQVATKTIPILFVAGDDPVVMGLVASLNRPGGNLTGVSMLNSELGAKRLDLLHKIVPTQTTIAFMVNPQNTGARRDAEDVKNAAAVLGRRLLLLEASTIPELMAAFGSLEKNGTAALIVNADAFFNTQRDQIIAAAAYNHTPTIYYERSYPAAGGLMSYGANLPDAYRQIGLYAGRLLKGERPSDLPVMQPTKFEFVINLQTAKSLGLDIPPAVMAIADEVIE